MSSGEFCQLSADFCRCFVGFGTPWRRGGKLHGSGVGICAGEAVAGVNRFWPVNRLVRIFIALRRYEPRASCVGLP